MLLRILQSQKLSYNFKKHIGIIFTVFPEIAAPENQIKKASLCVLLKIVGKQLQAPCKTRPPIFSGFSKLSSIKNCQTKNLIFYSGLRIFTSVVMITNKC